MVMHDSYPGKDTLWQNYTLKKFVPFNPVDKFTMAIVQENATGKIQRVMKGAPQVRRGWPWGCVTWKECWRAVRRWGSAWHPEEQLTCSAGAGTA